MRQIMKRYVLALLNILVFSNTQICTAVDSGDNDKIARNPIDYMIVVTGGEILEGVYPDAHTHFLTRTLRPLGFRCAGSVSVDDNREDLLRALAFATSRAAVVIVTGGLGPTPNDITRETISHFTGIPLREDSEVISTLEKQFNQSRDQLRPNLRHQAMIPARGRYLQNASGTAAGLVFDRATNLVVALPGPPRELQPMVKTELVPFFKDRFGTRSLGSSMTLRFVGVGQSLIDQTIKDHVTIASDVSVTSLFQGSRVDFTFSLPGDDAIDRKKLDHLKRIIIEQLREFIYSDTNESLEEIVLDSLKMRGKSLVVVEIGSGGRLASAFAGVQGASEFIMGTVAAPSQLQVEQLLQLPKPVPGLDSDPMKTLALSVARSMKSDLAIIVGRIEGESTGSVFLQVGFGSGEADWKSSRITVRGTPEVADPDAITGILDWIRRQSVR